MSTPVASDDESFDDGDYDPYSDAGPRYPVHDACEQQDAQFLRNLIFLPIQKYGDSDDDSDSDMSENGCDRGDSQSSDSSGTDGETDAAAAAAAATGQPLPPTSITTQNVDIESGSAELSSSIPKTKNDAKSPNQEKDKPDEDKKDSDENENGNGTGMEVDDTVTVTPNIGVIASPDKSKSSDTGVQNISPVKLDAEMIEQIAPNVQIPTSQLGIDVKDRLKGADDEEGTGTSYEKNESKKRKKKICQKDKMISYHCPHDLDLRDPDGNTALHVAIHARKLEHIRLLLEAGASPHQKCDYSAPIHTAISIGSITAHKSFAFNAVELLNKHGADLAMKDDSSHTPLYLATMYNVPSVVGSLLNDSIGVQTLNLKSDRTGGRPLHAAAKFDISKVKAVNGAAIATATGAGNGMGSPEAGRGSTKAILTQMLLGVPGIEVDAANNYGRSPLHVAASRGNWVIARLLLTAGADPNLKDGRGFTPGLIAYKRGMPIPVDLIPTLGPSNIPPSIQMTIEMPPKRDLIIDPEAQTFLICHELCSQHLTCPPISRNSTEPPPENVRRLSVLLDDEVGILRGAEFDGCKWEGESRRAAMADVLKVHEYKYIETISQICSEIPDHPNAIAHLDTDTGMSRWSFESAMRASGSVCEAVDRIMAGDFRNAFCAVRPPGHHAGPRGIVKCENDPEGSHGFCLLNNVAIGAAYARCMYRNDGIKKVAIIDFDVHHGNGTEAVIRNLVPSLDKATVRLPFAVGTMETPRYRPWLDETDVDNVFFASAHGYGPRVLVHHMNPHPGWFYPASGSSGVAQSVSSPGSVEKPDVEDFIFTQSWTRMGEEARMNCCKIINVGLNLPVPGETPGMQRVETRDAYRKNILPHLLDFNPDLIFISAGFDAHKRDEMNYGYVGMVEEDYEWLTEQLVKVANKCCNGRIVSVLEGGYRIHGGIVSPFARSVASHVRGLMEGGNSRELYDKNEGEWESRFEREMVEERERKRQLRMERLTRPYHSRSQRRSANATSFASVNEDVVHLAGTEVADKSEAYMDEMMQMPLTHRKESEEFTIKQGDNEGTNTEEIRPSKRKRNQVDYKELFEQMKKEQGLS